MRDSGLLHQILGLGTEKALLSHPKLGASWEGFAIEARVAIVYPGTKRYTVAARVEAVPLDTLADPGHLFEEDAR